MAEEKRQASPAKHAGEDKEFQHLVRVFNNDLKGEKQILFALTKIKGVGIVLSNAICRKAGVSLTKKAGYLSPSDVKALEGVIEDPLKAGLPVWMVNRRKDYETGQDKHVFSGNLDFTREMDIKRMKKTKSYVGLRHQWGLPVRGQKTKSNFRKNKGKGSLGVQKKKGKGGRV